MADRDIELLRAACEQAEKCVSVSTAFNVGAVLTTADGAVLSTGYSRELPGNTHAEECALMKLGILDANREAARGCTMYSTMEPCNERLSGKTPCAELLVRAGIARVVVAIAEPATFVRATGFARLKEAGVKVDIVEEPDIVRRARAVNAHVS